MTTGYFCANGYCFQAATVIIYPGCWRVYANQWGQYFFLKSCFSNRDLSCYVANGNA